MKIIKGLLVAFWFSDKRTKKAWGRIAGFFRQMFQYVFFKDKRASKKLFEQRMSACRACPVFYKRLETCGSPLDKELEGLGCWCALNLKARIKDSTCWMDDKMGDDSKNGWREAAKSGTV